jgi:NADH pyrophosphatase NudC (nudix superfamily)
MMTMNNTVSPLDMPALNGRGVTEAHARICAARGHATHTRDGVDTGVCPRCGDVTTPAA